ncbi:MAG: hypothetical protein ACOYMR_10250 [Ilumatobacteraceae bacterium]
MKLLLIESTPGNATAIQSDLVADGHEVVSCHDDHGGPCRGVQHHADCPMEQHLDMAIVTRDPRATHTLHEMGSVCAAQHRVPLVEVDPQDVADDLPSVQVAHAVATRRVEAGYAAAVRQELGNLPAIVDVRRDLKRVHVTVQVPASVATASRLSAVADRARFAAREHDPFVSGIDVSVVTYPDPAD